VGDGWDQSCLWGKKYSNDIEDIIEFVWNWVVNDGAGNLPGSGTFLYRYMQRKWLKSWGKVNLGHLADG
jgi:hypothetical protein